MHMSLRRTHRSCGWLLAAGRPAGRGAMARRLRGRTSSCEALRGARTQLDPTMLHQGMPGRDLCDQMPAPRITPPLREQLEQRHRHYGSWGATEQETGVSQCSPSQNSYFLRKKAAHGGMGSYSFAKVSCKSQNLCDNFCKGVDVNY